MLNDPVNLIDPKGLMAAQHFFYAYGPEINQAGRAIAEAYGADGSPTPLKVAIDGATDFVEMMANPPVYPPAYDTPLPEGPFPDNFDQRLHDRMNDMLRRQEELRLENERLNRHREYIERRNREHNERNNLCP